MTKKDIKNSGAVDHFDFETAHWMKNLHEDISINQLIMPGSHDAGMSELDHCDVGSLLNKGMVKTQDISIGKQLEAGSRYFDIRVDYDHNKLVTYHRSGDLGCNGQSLENVLDQSVDFIKSYRSETFILKFSHIRSNRGKSSDIKQRIDALLSQAKYKDYILVQSDTNINLAKCPLKSLRGKIILVFDYPEYINPNQGRFRYNDGFEVDKSETKVIRLKGYAPNLTVCDSYSNTTDLENMMADQLDKLNTYGGLDKDYLFLLSWTLTAGIGTFFGGSIKELAAKANSALPDVLYQQIVVSAKSAPNIVYLDFVDETISKSVIQYNFLNINTKNE
jgi:1-phosphatidylinositol phosphodiesterase